MGPQEAKEFFTEHLEERRRSYDDRKLTPAGNDRSSADYT